MNPKDLALRLLEEAEHLQREGDIDGAIEKYRASIAAHPTADAHTYLGWMLSFQGRIEDAIEQCKIAIELDPEFGNPYNDIGVYLMGQGKMDEAESWLRRATIAHRYEPRHFPHINLGRIYAARQQYGAALGELVKARQHAPEDSTSAHLIRELVGKLNGSLGKQPPGLLDR